MSGEAVRAVLLRAAVDESFLNAMLAEPRQALEGYDLDQEEYDALASHSPQILQHAYRRGDTAALILRIPEIWLFAFIETDPLIRARLEAILSRRLTGAVEGATEAFASLEELRSLSPEERERYCLSLLEKWEGLDNPPVTLGRFEGSEGPDAGQS